MEPMESTEAEDARLDGVGIPHRDAKAGNMTWILLK